MSQYTIVSGDTFFSIGKKLGVSVAALEQANPGVNPSNLQIGQTINVPSDSLSTSDSNSRSSSSTFTYVILSGDTFFSISKKFGVSVSALEQVNRGVNPQNLQIGQVITIPNNNRIAATNDFRVASSKYTVVAGDTFFSIGQKLGLSVADIEQANPGVNPENLQIGQVITIPGNNGQSQPTNPPPNYDGQNNGYVNYSGPASNFPDPSTWASFATLWKHNSALMRPADSNAEVTQVKHAIDTVSKESGVDARVITAIMMQESGGNVRIPTVSTNLSTSTTVSCVLT